MSTSKVAVNGSSTATTPSTQDAIMQALLQTGGIKRIQATVAQRLDEQGWTENLYKFIEAQLRSGESKTYNDLREKLDGFIKIEGQDGAVAGSAAVMGDPANLVVGRDAVIGCGEAIKKELEKVCDMTK